MQELTYGLDMISPLAANITQEKIISIIELGFRYVEKLRPPLVENLFTILSNVRLYILFSPWIHSR